MRVSPKRRPASGGSSGGSRFRADFNSQGGPELRADYQAEADRAFDGFIEMFAAKYPAAVECLTKDRDVLLTFYDFPAEHWGHLRTTNPIESTFATVRLRHRRTKGNGTRAACLTMVFKLCESAARKWRALNGIKRLPDVIAGVQFIDGEKPEKDAA